MLHKTVLSKQTLRLVQLGHTVALLPGGVHLKQQAKKTSEQNAQLSEPTGFPLSVLAAETLQVCLSLKGVNLPGSR